MNVPIRSNIITLLTDFGADSHYVAEMKGAILSFAPQATLIDLTHSIPPQNIRQAAWVFDRTFRSFPEGSIHVLVVDPGVGSSRKIITGNIDHQLVVAPDNGLLSVALSRAKSAELFELTNDGFSSNQISNTFHGRDIMGPAAAHLCLGKSLEDCGPQLDLQSLVSADWQLSPRQIDSETMEAEVIYSDSFGNLITNLRLADLPQSWQIDKISVSTTEHKVSKVVQTYSDAQINQVVALFGSSNQLELAVVNGSYSGSFQLEPGDSVKLVHRQ